MGSILENIFAQMLTANGFSLRYFDKKGKCELDFVIQKGEQIYPLEIKSGKFYKDHVLSLVYGDISESASDKTGMARGSGFIGIGNMRKV